MSLSLPGIFPLAGEYWERTNKADVRGSRLADAHYSRQARGARLYMPPGNTVTLVLPDGSAVFGWHRPDPSSGVKRMDGFDGWCCSIFRNESTVLSSRLVLDAERVLVREGVTCGLTGLFTYVEPGKVRSRNPGYCFLKAGWAKTDHWSTDGKKRLYVKPWFAAGTVPLGEWPQEVLDLPLAHYAERSPGDGQGSPVEMHPRSSGSARPRRSRADQRRRACTW